MTTLCQLETITGQLKTSENKIDCGNEDFTSRTLKQRDGGKGTVQQRRDAFLKHAKKIHNNIYDYSKFVYIHSKIKSIIICPIHGEFLQSPNNHISKKQNCPRCVCGRNVFNTYDFIKQSKIIHKNKYDYSESIYTQSHSKLRIRCPTHGIFYQAAYKHLNGCGCYECGIENKEWANSFKRKKYIFPDGRIEYIQGFEAWTLDHLLSESINHNNIVVKRKEIPVIRYNWNGKIHRYYPDCYIPSSKTIVETKSNYLWKMQRSQIIAKIKECLNSGYNIRLIIWENRKKLISDTTYVVKLY